MRTLNDTIVKTIKDLVTPRLPDRSYKAFIFGSRARGRSRRFSDIDLGIVGPKPVPSKQYADIVQILKDSDIPFHTDVVDFAHVSDAFKKQALKNIITL